MCKDGLDGAGVTGGFVTRLWLLSVCPTSTVARFSFLTPIFALLPGRRIFAESLSPGLLTAAALAGVEITLIDRRG